MRARTCCHHAQQGDSVWKYGRVALAPLLNDLVFGMSENGGTRGTSALPHQAKHSSPRGRGKSEHIARFKCTFIHTLSRSTLEQSSASRAHVLSAPAKFTSFNLCLLFVFVSPVSGAPAPLLPTAMLEPCQSLDSMRRRHVAASLHPSEATPQRGSCPSCDAGPLWTSAFLPASFPSMAFCASASARFRSA